MPPPLARRESAPPFDKGPDWVELVDAPGLPPELTFEAAADVLAAEGIETATREATSGSYRADGLPAALYVHPDELPRAGRLLVEASREAEPVEPAGGAEAEREIEELRRQGEWSRYVPLAITIASVLAAVLLSLLSRCSGT